MMRKKNVINIKLNNNIFQFCEFDINDIIYNYGDDIILSRIIIIGKDDRNKSLIIRDILYHISSISYIIYIIYHLYHMVLLYLHQIE